MKRILLLAALCASVLLSCNNFFHDLVPDGDRILSFSIPGQIESSIGEHTLTVPPGTELWGVPSVSVSQGATVLPVTMDYILGAFPGEQFFGALDLYTGGNLTEQVQAEPGFYTPRSGQAGGFYPSGGFFGDLGPGHCTAVPGGGGC